MTDVKEADKVEVLDERQPDRKVTVGGKNYLVREMDDESLGKWLNLQFRAMSPSRNGDAEFPRHSELIGLCLHDAQGARVPREVVKKFGARTLNRLYEICQDLNGLGARVEDREKKG